MSGERTDAEMAEYVREHRCWRADPDVSLAEWDRGVKAIEQQSAAIQAGQVVGLREALAVAIGEWEGMAYATAEQRAAIKKLWLESEPSPI